MKALEPSLTSVNTSSGSGWRVAHSSQYWRIVSVQCRAQRGSEWFPVRSLGTSEDSGGAHLPSDIGDTETEFSQWRASEETGHSDNSDIRQLLPVCDLLLC